MLDFWEDELKTVYGHYIAEDFVFKGLHSFIYQLLEEQKKRTSIEYKDKIAQLKVYHEQCIQQMEYEMEALLEGYKYVRE